MLEGCTKIIHEGIRYFSEKDFMISHPQSRPLAAKVSFSEYHNISKCDSVLASLKHRTWVVELDAPSSSLNYVMFHTKKALTEVYDSSCLHYSDDEIDPEECRVRLTKVRLRMIDMTNNNRRTLSGIRATYESKLWDLEKKMNREISEIETRSDIRIKERKKQAKIKYEKKIKTVKKEYTEIIDKKKTKINTLKEVNIKVKAKLKAERDKIRQLEAKLARIKARGD